MGLGTESSVAAQAYDIACSKVYSGDVGSLLQPNVTRKIDSLDQA